MIKREIKSSKYHLVWTPKYRKNFLRGLIKYHVEKSLKFKASELKVEICIKNMVAASL